MNKKVKTQALRRLAIAEGHLRKVKNMVESDEYCPDVIHQSQAIQAALKKVDEVILEGHLNECVLNGMHSAKSNKNKMVGEILDVFRKGNK